MTNLRQMEATEQAISGRRYYIRPFGAFKAANLSGELASMLAPLLSLFTSMADTDAGGMMDADIEKAAKGIGGAFDGISGDRMELLLRKLLIKEGNVSVEVEDTNGSLTATRLTEDLMDEIFCGEVQDMYILAFHVIKLNYNGFFKKAGGLFGKAEEAMGMMKAT